MKEQEPVSLVPIQNDSVAEEVLKRLTQLIVRGQVKPGEKLPSESELSIQLGVGRNSIREAVKMLTAMGVLTIRRGYGTYVSTTVSPVIFNPLIFNLVLESRSSEHLYGLRVMLESTVMLMAMQTITADEISAIRRLLREHEAMWRSGRGTIEDFVKMDIEFHLSIFRSLHNPLVETIGSTVLDLFQYAIQKALSIENGIAISINNHNRLLDLLEQRAVSEVIGVVEATLTEWRSYLKD